MLPVLQPVQVSGSHTPLVQHCRQVLVHPFTDLAEKRHEREIRDEDCALDIQPRTATIKKSIVTERVNLMLKMKVILLDSRVLIGCCSEDEYHPFLNTENSTRQRIEFYSRTPIRLAWKFHYRVHHLSTRSN